MRHLIVPVRGQQQLYERFMTNLIKHKRSEWDIRVFVVNQVDEDVFRPGWHYNIGILKSFSEGKPRCIITHDVHVLVEENVINYSLCGTPTEICLASKCFQDGLSDNRSRVRIFQATPQEWRLSDGYTNTRTIFGDVLDNMKLRFQSNVLLRKNRIRQLSVPNDKCKCMESSVDRKNTNISGKGSHNYAKWRKDGLNSIKYHMHNEYVDKFGAKWIEVSKEPYLSNEELQQLSMTFMYSPIVVAKYKLFFFYNEKSGCSYWKRLLQYIQNITNTNQIHSPASNKLSYLRNFNTQTIASIYMMYDKSWIKAAFVREPRERILSAYLNKVVDENALIEFCNEYSKTFTGFLKVIKTCQNIHWNSQVRAPVHFYKNMIIGKMEHIFEFTELLLKKIGA